MIVDCELPIVPCFTATIGKNLWRMTGRGLTLQYCEYSTHIRTVGTLSSTSTWLLAQGNDQIETQNLCHNTGHLLSPAMVTEVLTWNWVLHKGTCQAGLLNNHTPCCGSLQSQPHHPSAASNTILFWKRGHLKKESENIWTQQSLCRSQWLPEHSPVNCSNEKKCKKHLLFDSLVAIGVSCSQGQYAVLQ